MSLCVVSSDGGNRSARQGQVAQPDMGGCADRDSVGSSVSPTARFPVGRYALPRRSVSQACGTLATKRRSRSVVRSATLNRPR